jgi:hypothetical protein
MTHNIPTLPFRPTGKVRNLKLGNGPMTQEPRRNDPTARIAESRLRGGEEQRSLPYRGLGTTIVGTPRTGQVLVPTMQLL